MVIDHAQSVTLILDRLPRFEPALQANRRRLSLAPLGACADLSAFADWILELTCDPAANEPCIREAFALIETFIALGDDEVKTAATVSCLESVFNILGQTALSSTYAVFLGPLSRDYIRSWDDFSGLRTPGLWEGAQ
jgi:hypothetical protein